MLIRGLLVLAIVAAVVFAASSVNKQEVAKKVANQSTNQSSVEGAKVTGFDEFGYNRNARIFNGTCVSWGMGKFGWTEIQAQDYCGSYSNDKLVMKWNAEWDRGNTDGWNQPPYQAWTDNEWNGMKGGSGEVWHYKIKWIGSCGADGTVLPDGGYCIWGQFEVVMDQGTSGGEHFWFTKATPNGYGIKP